MERESLLRKKQNLTRPAALRNPEPTGVRLVGCGYAKFTVLGQNLQMNFVGKRR